MNTPNNTRDALAAECKRLADCYMLAGCGKNELHTAIDRLAALASDNDALADDRAAGQGGGPPRLVVDQNETGKRLSADAAGNLRDEQRTGR